MRISDWSSDVCSSDLLHSELFGGDAPAGRALERNSWGCNLCFEDWRSFEVERAGAPFPGPTAKMEWLHHACFVCPGVCPNWRNSAPSSRTSGALEAGRTTAPFKTTTDYFKNTPTR